MGRKSLPNSMSATVINKKVMVVSAYLNNCLCPCRFDSGKTICRDMIKPAVKVMGKESAQAPSSGEMAKL